MAPSARPTNVRDVLAYALADVEAARIPDELVEAAFVKAVDLYAGDLSMPAAVHTPLPTIDYGPHGRSEAPLEPLARIAERLGIDGETVADVYDDSNGHLEIVVPPSRLPSQNAAATKVLALVVAAGRQAAGYDESGWTSYAAIRSVCEDYRKLDASNFATTLREMADVFATRIVSARKREVRVARPGWDRAAQLVIRLSGAE